MTAAPALELSSSAELLLRLRWLAILHGHVGASLALTGGVETWQDGVKGILAGAHAVQMVSALLRHGPQHLGTMVEKLRTWMEWQHVASIDEMRHAEALIERLLFLDGVPNMTEPMQLTIGANVQAQLNSDLKLELDAVVMYNDAVKLAREEGDDASRDLFAMLLKSEEEHVDWLEAQLHQIKEMGYERYLGQQIGETKE